MLKGARESTSNYLIKQLPKATAFLNKKLEVVHVSDKWIDYFEFSDRNVTGKNLKQLFKNSDRKWLKILKECLEGKTSEVSVQNYSDKNHNEKWFEWVNIPWYDESENIIGVIIQTEDITQRVLNEQKLEKLEALFDEKAEISKIGTWEYDAVKDNLIWCNMTKTIHEVPMDFIPDIDAAINFYKSGYSRNTISMAVDNAMREGTPWKEKLQLITAKGNEIWVIAAGRPLFKNGKFIGLIGSFQDINNRVTAEIKTRENERLLRTLIDNLPLNVFIKDLESRKVLVNKSEIDFCGAKNENEIIGKNDFEFYDFKTATSFRKDDLKVMKSQKPVLNKEDVSVKNDGTITTFLTSKIPLFDENNEVEGLIGMSIDISEKRKVQKDLEEKERYFRSIFNSSYQFTGILSKEGTFIEINDTALDFADLKASDVIGKKFWDAYWWPVPDFIKDGLKQIVQAATKGQFMRSEIIVLDKNKEQVPVDFSLKPIYDDDNKVVSLLAEGRMITEMVASREKLKESEQKFRTLYELSPVSYFLYDFETGEILDFNPAFMSTTGYDKNSIKEIKYWDLLANKSEKIKTQITSELESHGTFGPIEEKYVRKDSSEYPVIINKSLIVGKKGRKLVWTIVQDISESEKKEKRIRKEQKLLRTLIDHLPLRVFVKDNESRKILVNKAECNNMGVDSPQELLGKNDFELYDKEYAQEARAEDLQVMDSLKPILAKEKIIQKNDGTAGNYLVSKIPLKGEDGKVSGLVGIGLEITEIKQKEEELRSLINVTSLQNKKLINFAHIVSHNLRSHTANFSMLLEFLVNERDDSERQNIMSMLVEASDNLLETLDNLNEVVAISSNVNIKKVSVNLNTKIDGVTKNLSAFLKKNKTELINTIKNDVCIPVVPAYIDSILMNFITNAVKYKSPERKPIIKLSAQRSKGYIILCIEDNGLGIDLKRYGDKLFGMYKTFHNNDDARGIGLYISKNQIDAMNGKIVVQSEVNKGTLFKIYFNEKN
jgi:PAS domain S-box-containing protein